MKGFVVILLLTIASLGAAGQTIYSFSNSMVDSLERLYYGMRDRDTCRLSVALQLTIGHNVQDSALAWSNRLIDLAVKVKRPYYLANAMRLKGFHLSIKGDYNSAIKTEYDAIIIADSIRDYKLKAKCLAFLGRFYSSLTNYSAAIDHLSQALDIFSGYNDSTRVADIYRQMGYIFMRERAWDKSIEVITKAAKLDAGNKACQELNSDYVYLGNSYLGKYEFSFHNPDISLCAKVKECLLKVIDSDCLSLIVACDCYRLVPAVLAYELKHYKYKGERRQQVVDSMHSMLDLGYEYFKMVNNDFFQIRMDFCKVSVLIAERNMPEARRMLDSLDIAIGSYEDGFREYAEMSTSCWRDYYYEVGDLPHYYEYSNMYFDLILNSISSDETISASLKIAQSEYENKLRQRDEREERRHRLRLYMIIGVLLAMALILVEYFRKLHINKILNDKNAEINLQNKNITDSINYASLIQKAALPTSDYLRECFSDYFMIYRPLYIVAGDFYWARSIGGYKILVCADCTGHGVPGAFVSMLGISLLNELSASVSQTTTASGLLNELRRKFKLALGQDIDLYQQGKPVNMDGIDMSLAIIDTRNNVLQYAGAYRSMWIWRDGQLTELRGDKQPVGLFLGQEKDFANSIYELHGGETLYMFTDGITDQYGTDGLNPDKPCHFTSRRLQTLVENIATLPMHEQKIMIEQAIDNWQANNPQLDDNLMIGVKL